MPDFQISGVKQDVALDKSAVFIGRGCDVKTLRNTRLVSAFLQDLHRVEAKRHEKQLREKEQEERQRRLAAKLKEKVRGLFSCGKSNS